MENWKPVKNYEGIYEISDHGNVHSLSRKVKSRNNCIIHKKDRILKQALSSEGYPQVTLAKNSINKNTYIHHLVAEAFWGPRPNYHPCQVIHLDGNKTNNHYKNLRFASASCNSAFMIDDDTVSRGTKRYNAKLNEELVRKIRTWHNKKEFSRREMANIIGVSFGTICHVLAKETWTWVE